MFSEKTKDIIRYNNITPLFLIVAFVASSSAFALTNENVQNAIVNTTTKVLSVDNTYIANVNLTNYSPRVTILNVQENEDSYIVTYNFETIDNIDFVWKPVTVSRDLRVDKKVLGQYKDLGVFVTEELKQVIDQEKLKLLAIQEIEKKNISQKVVATQYSGLIGKLLDENTEVLPGYVPVNNQVQQDTVTEVVTPVKEIFTPTPTPVVDNQNSTSTATTTIVNTEVNNVNVQIVGPENEEVFVGSVYTDKGVFVNNASTESIQLKINGSDVSSISIDTASESINTIIYVVTTNKGVFELTRTVRVVATPTTTTETTPTPTEFTPTPTPTETTIPEPAAPIIEQVAPPVTE